MWPVGELTHGLVKVHIVTLQSLLSRVSLQHTKNKLQFVKKTSSRKLQESLMSKLHSKSRNFMQISSTYRKAHISELLDETVHDPRLIRLVGHLSLIIKKTFLFGITILFLDVNHLSVCYLIDRCCFLTLLGPFLGPLPQELQEELLSWEVGLFHMSPSSASHWPVDMLMSSPAFPQLSCIGLGPREKMQWSHRGQFGDKVLYCQLQIFAVSLMFLNWGCERPESVHISMWPLGGTVVF